MLNHFFKKTFALLMVCIVTSSTSTFANTFTQEEHHTEETSTSQIACESECCECCECCDSLCETSCLLHCKNTPNFEVVPPAKKKFQA